MRFLSIFLILGVLVAPASTSFVLAANDNSVKDKETTYEGTLSADNFTNTEEFNNEKRLVEINCPQDVCAFSGLKFKHPNTVNTLYVNAHAVGCRKIETVAGHDLFIPARTKAEWQSFIQAGASAGSPFSVIDCVGGGGTCTNLCSDLTTVVIPEYAEGNDFVQCSSSSTGTCDNEWKATSWKCISVLYRPNYYQPKADGSACAGIYFPEIDNAPLGSMIESAIVRHEWDTSAMGLTDWGTSYLSNPSGEFRVCNDDACSYVVHDWGKVERTINTGVYLQLRQISHAEWFKDRKVYFYIGRDSTYYSGDWLVTTTPGDNSPDPVVFAETTGVPRASNAVSDIVQITGIDSAAVWLNSTSTGFRNVEFRVCSTPDCSTVVQDWGQYYPDKNSQYKVVLNDQYLQVKVGSSLSFETPVTVTFFVGTQLVSWTVITRADECDRKSAGQVCTNGALYGGSGYGLMTDFYKYMITPADGPRNNWQEANQYCKDLVAHGYDNWTLPDRGELNLILYQGVHRNSPGGNFSNSFADYWSSTEEEGYCYNCATNAYGQGFIMGTQELYPKVAPSIELYKRPLSRCIRYY